MLRNWWTELTHLVTAKHIESAVSAIVILILGMYLAKRASQALGRVNQIDPQQRLLLQKASYYGLVLFTIASSLNQLGFDLKVLLGAAGLLTVAVGFAAQTSASNLISGLFLMVDRPFVVGNSIQIDSLQGEVIAIDLLSTRLRTLDNQMVRVPNETMVKSNIVNKSFFPLRRFDVAVGVAYDSDIREVQNLLLETAKSHPRCVADPAPVCLLTGFGDSSINLVLQAWTLTDEMLVVRSELHAMVKATLDAAGVEIPFPHRILVSKPAPVERRPTVDNGPYT